MTANIIIDRDLNIFIRLGSWAVVAFSILGLSIAPANGSLLYQREVNRVEQLTNKFDNGWNASDEFSCDASIEFVSYDHSQVSGVSSSKSFEIANIVCELEPFKLPILVEGGPSSSSSKGATNTGSTNGRGRPAPIAIAHVEFALPIPLLLSWPSIEQSLNVPPGPPFELLRPPTIFTASA